MPQGEIDRYCEIAELWHWRSRTRPRIERGDRFPVNQELALRIHLPPHLGNAVKKTITLYNWIRKLHFGKKCAGNHSIRRSAISPNLMAAQVLRLTGQG